MGLLTNQITATAAQVAETGTGRVGKSAGVSIIKAGATAAIGSILAAFAMAGSALVFSAGMPVILGAVIVVPGFYLAASLVDAADNALGMKKTAAEWAR